METSSKTIIFISQHFGNPKSQDFVTLPDIKNVELIFSFCCCGFLIFIGNLKILKSEMFEKREVWKHKQRPNKSKICLNKY